jgi:hypothetical protein
MRLLAAVAAATVVLGSLTVPAVASAQTPEIRVSRTSGLSGGDEVRVGARGFAPGSEVRIVQCDVFVDWIDGDCPDRTVTTAGSTGRIANRVTATPSTNLAAAQWVLVRGTAYGAAGRQVRIVQHACFEIIQETGCYGERATVTPASAPTAGTRRRTG